jgi:hypothetical protein
MSPTHIDVGAILEAAYQPVYCDLVTRATGRTVRTRIEERLADRGPVPLTVIDFSRVGLIDFSCADEIVATLVRRSCDDTPGYDGCFLFDGISDAHLDAIEHVLERDALALVVRLTGAGTYRLIGRVGPHEREIWEIVVRERHTDALFIASALGLDETEVSRALSALAQRRLLMREGARFRAPVGAVA